MNIADKGFDFAIRIAELVHYLRDDGKGFPLCERLLDCGVSTGLACRAGKKNAAAECVNQADFIIEMAVKAGYLTQTQSVHIHADCAGLLKLLAEHPQIEGNPIRDSGE